MKYAFISVEGPHDVELIARVLKQFDFKHDKMLENVSEFWRPIIPNKFPHEGDLLKRMPVPSFYSRGDEYSVAVYSVGGTDFKKAEKAFSVIDGLNSIYCLGVFSDNDPDKGGIQKVFDGVKSDFPMVEFPDSPGMVKDGKPRTGIFIFPNNQDEGTIEAVLLKCARKNYPNLHQCAQAYVGGVDLSVLERDEAKEINKPFGKAKAIVGSVGSVLKPGKAIQNSLHDNKWINSETLSIPEVEAVMQFIKSLFAL